MHRPKFDHRPLFVDRLHNTLLGTYPEKEKSLREVMEVVMRNWDSGKINETEREGARVGLCQIGMKWHVTDGLPYSLGDVVQKLVEITPELRGKEVNGHTMLAILNRHRLPAQSR